MRATASPPETAEATFAGPGELRRLCRELDWSSTPLGPVAGWPQSLRTAASVTLGSRFASILVWGPDLVQIYNDAYRALIGDRHPAALGRPTHETWPELRPLQEPIFARVFAGETVELDGAHYPLDRHGVVEDAVFDADFVPVRGEDGRVHGSLSTVFEVTGRDEARALAERLRASEARFRAVFEQVPLAVAVMEGPDHVYTMVTPRYAELAGGRPLHGRTLREAFPEMNDQPYPGLIGRAYATGEPIALSERVLWFDRDGDGVPEEYVVDIRYTPLRDAAGQVFAVASAAVDVTGQVRARQQLEVARHAADHARAEAEHASRAKSEFLAIMSHELRTPLNAIGGYAELVEMGIRGPVTDAQREDLRRIQTSQRHLLGLINEVLNYARLETGAVHFDVEDVRVAEALAGAEGLVAPQMRAKGLKLSVGACPADLAVRADAEKLRQVLVNLLSNAVKFTDRGGSVEMAARAGDGVVSIRVRDTGIGIPAEKLEAIFEPFVQVRSDLTRTAEGTGLGLAISRDLARGMDGDLTVESAPGAGSTFTLTLPRAEVP